MWFSKFLPSLGSAAQAVRKLPPSETVFASEKGSVFRTFFPNNFRTATGAERKLSEDVPLCPRSSTRGQVFRSSIAFRSYERFRPKISHPKTKKNGDFFLEISTTPEPKQLSTRNFRGFFKSLLRTRLRNLESIRPADRILQIPARPRPLPRPNFEGASLEGHTTCPESLRSQGLSVAKILAICCFFDRKIPKSELRPVHFGRISNGRSDGRLRAATRIFMSLVLLSVELLRTRFGRVSRGGPGSRRRPKRARARFRRAAEQKPPGLATRNFQEAFPSGRSTSAASLKETAPLEIDGIEEEEKKKKPTTLGVPRRSPIQVLSQPDDA